MVALWLMPNIIRPTYMNWQRWMGYNFKQWFKKNTFANTPASADFFHTQPSKLEHRGTETARVLQTGAIVIAISQRRHIIVFIKNDLKYVLRERSTELARLIKLIQTLEKYVSYMDRVLNNLNTQEFPGYGGFNWCNYSIQRTEMVMRIQSWNREVYMWTRKIKAT